MNTARLLRIAEIVEAVPPEQFNMGRWYPLGGTDECGTACCAIGHAAQQSDIQKQGLTLVPSGPRYQYFYDFEAVAAFLDIDESLAVDLFSPDSYYYDDKPQFVAKCIRYVASGNKVPDYSNFGRPDWESVIDG